MGEFVDVAKFALIALAVVLVLVLVVPRFVVRNVPADLIAGMNNPHDRVVVENERIRMRNDVRNMVVQIITAVAIVAGVVVTYHTAQANDDAQRTASLLTQFTTATNRLSNPSKSVRIAAIEELKSLAETGDDRTQAVSNVLNGFISERSPWPPSDTSPYPSDMDVSEVPWMVFRAGDVHAAVRALGSGALGSSTYARLSGDLRRTDLRDGNYSEADIRNAHFEGALFNNADLREAILFNVHLERASLRDAKLCGADLGVIYVDDDTDFTGVVADALTEWPDDFDAKARGVTKATNDEDCTA